MTMPEVERKVLEEERIEYMPPYLMFFPPEAAKKIDPLTATVSILAPWQKENLCKAGVRIEAECPLFTKEGQFVGFHWVTIDGCDITNPWKMREVLKEEGCKINSVKSWADFDIEEEEGKFVRETAAINVVCSKISAADLYEKLKVDMKRKYPTLADFKREFGEEFGYCEIGISRGAEGKPDIRPDNDVATYILVMREIYRRLKSDYPEMMHAFGGCVEEKVVRKVGEVVRGE